VNNNELVAPPAGAIGRGDAFVLSIANKVNAIILTNDSYQEFHGQYDWLFDEGRLVGGKPVPHIGWVFVNRLPVRGPISRKSTSEAKKRTGRGGKSTELGSVRVGSAEASKPMPVPTAPPPGAALPGKRTREAQKPKLVAAAAAAAAPVAAAAPASPSAHAPARHGGVNDLMSFLTFVEQHPLGTSVNAIVDHYSSHGAYVKVGEVVGYVPLRLMAEPAPRSAREFMKVGEAITLVVDKFLAEKRSIDLAVPGMGTVPQVEAKPAKAAKRTAKKAAPPAVEVEPVTPKPKRVSKKAAAAAAAPVVEPVVDVPSAAPAPVPAKKAAAKKAVAKKAVAQRAVAERAVAQRAVAETTALVAEAPAVPVRKVPVTKPAAKKAPAKKAAAKKPAAPVKTTAAKKAAAPAPAAATRRGRTTA
jgi:hypothetical protein